MRAAICQFCGIYLLQDDGTTTFGTSCVDGLHEFASTHLVPIENNDADSYVEYLMQYRHDRPTNSWHIIQLGAAL